MCSMVLKLLTLWSIWYEFSEGVIVSYSELIKRFSKLLDVNNVSLSFYKLNYHQSCSHISCIIVAKSFHLHSATKMLILY